MVRWQVQEAKQRFSELLRRASEEGPQAVTKHGEEVAFVIDAAYYRQLTGVTVDFEDYLFHGPKDDGFADALDEIVAERRSTVEADTTSSIFDEA